MMGGSSVHRDMARGLLEDFMETPEGARCFQWHAAKIRSGGFDDLYRDSIHQDRDGWPLEQIAAFIHVHAAVMGGDVAAASIDTGGFMPSPDSERASNAGRLGELPDPLVAEVDLDQHCADSDGYLRWTRTVQMSVSTRIRYIEPCGCKHRLDMRRAIEPACVPLEIGTTSASTTLFHLMRDRGVARWPYGHDRIAVLVMAGASQRWRWGI